MHNLRGTASIKQLGVGIRARKRGKVNESLKTGGPERGATPVNQSTEAGDQLGCLERNNFQTLEDGRKKTLGERDARHKSLKRKKCFGPQ